MFSIKELKRAFLTSLWFMFLTFPLLVMKVNTITDTVIWRWMNLLYVGVGSFFLSILWKYLLERRDRKGSSTSRNPLTEKISKYMEKKNDRYSSMAVLILIVLLYPFIMSMYQTSILTTALMYVVLGLGLNIVVGFGGLLHLGYAAFYAVGAYTYGLLFYHFGLGFWVCLPLGAILSALFGIILGFPILRLRGDYLAIVTLAFGQMVRLILENWNDFSFGPSGIANIPRPDFFGKELNLAQVTNFTYFIAIGLTILTIFVIRRMESSKMGRAWEAMREDEIACQSMGIDIARAKLTAFSMGALWAGIMGVLFAAKTTFINPASFTTWESIVILCIVVIGGMGSIPGVIVGALLFILTPEYLRAFSQYRMLIFGIALVLMMIFRPGGIIPKVRKSYKFAADKNKSQEGEA
ncbi:branched-chain amino acid ABC transporter permease [Oceanispirochaeta sp.]|jgi:branched-chain amino acid transport system permease protein|uniref:ABC transporter permease subunit n=1 Tax=Oceanispirochaeta sp. TaxID=2035350 RepID=UPI002629A0C0|nr:branched-chain amino acid ABC transporter permease [Oceanispirochaeta sp.]MDA3958111.1 branched-chain amino acid ABC transporter permease [Oceanispirochaeta sp.]